MDEENPIAPEPAAKHAKPFSAASEKMGDRITKGCLGCGCFVFILLIVGVVVSLFFSGANSAESALGGGVKFAMIVGGAIVIVVLVFFLMRLDMVMARFKN